VVVVGVGDDSWPGVRVGSDETCDAGLVSGELELLT